MLVPQRWVWILVRLALGLAFSPLPMTLAQQYVISTYAGSPAATELGDGGPANAAQLKGPSGLALDASGNLLIVENGGQRVRQVSIAGTISTVAGNGNAGFAGDGATATNARLNYARSVAVDASGNLYIADTGNFRVRRIAGGSMSTMAGTGFSGFAGDGGPASSAVLSQPRAVAVDGSAQVYIADGNRIRKIATDGKISTIAGDDLAAYSGDGGPAIFARLNNPQGLTVDAAGNLYIADTFNQRVRKIDSSGAITTVAGTGSFGYSGDGGPATNAQLSGPTSLAFDRTGNLYVAEFSRIRKILPNGDILTLAGIDTPGHFGDGLQAYQAQLHNPLGVAVDAAGNVFVADTTNNVVRVIQSTALSLFAVTNAASNLSGHVAPGEVITIYGAGIGPLQLATAEPSTGVISTQLGDVQVLFNGVPGPVLYALSTQVSAIVPYAVSGSVVAVQVQVQDQKTAGLGVPLAVSAPGIFSRDSSGKGQAAALNQDGSPNSAQNPAVPGSVIVLFATGEGKTTGGVDGAIVAEPYPTPLLSVHVNIGGIDAEVAYAGGAPGQVTGIMQLNVRVPEGVVGAEVPVVLTVGSASSAPLTIAVSFN